MNINWTILFLSKYFFYPIVIGIISTVCYVLIFDKLFSKIILPWYFSKKYKSTLIGGKWNGKTKSFTFNMTLNQTGDKVKGEMVVESIQKLSTSSEEIKIIDTNKYCFEGEIKDGFVRITHKEKDRNSFGFGCFMFQIAGGGKILNGSVIYVDESEDAYFIGTHENIKLERVAN
ncbi:MAG: hypothetical protein V4504_01075 [Patescibacteria group bacterium]